MKRFGLLILTALLLVGLLAGCGGAEGQDEALIGAWAWDDTSSWEYVFEADGSGVRGAQGHGEETFTWSTNASGRLTLNLDSGREQWDYTIAGANTLTLTSRNLTYTYSRLGQRADFIGSWAWDEDAGWEYVFEADGTGTRGFPPQVESFEWATTADGRLRLRYGGTYSEWTYLITDSTLTMTHTRFANTEFHYARVLDEGNPALVGTWHWVDDSDWEYIFDANGQGKRGWLVDGDVEDFTWTTTANNQIIMRFGDYVEGWGYSIAGNRLTLRFEDIVFQYTRQD